MKDVKKTVVIISNGLDDERSSVAWSLARAGGQMGQEMTVFLVSSGVDWARKGAADKLRMNPLDPSMSEMIQGLISEGTGVYACPPCAEMRGYSQDSLVDGVTIAGPDVLYGLLEKGAATISI